MAFRRAFDGVIPEEFLWRKKEITRDSTHLRHVLERKFGKSPYRYKEIYKKLFCESI
jgi:hypothetical protein